MSIECAESSKSAAISSLRALLLSLILGTLGAFLLFSILDTVAVFSAPQGKDTLDTLGRGTSISTAAPATTTVYITKTVEPSDPSTGEIVSICFTISGLGPRKLDVVLAQDISGSMKDLVREGATQTRLEASQVAASAFVSHLRTTDRAAVVPYSSTACLAQPLTAYKSEITETIYSLYTEEQWSTNIGEGISVSHEELITSSRYASDTVKAIILLSDGIANRPKDDPKGYALARASAAASDSIRIYTIGFGSDADEELLQDIANISGGGYFFAPDSDVLETVYLTIVLKLYNLVITDILTPGVEADCSGWQCVGGPGGFTTANLPISDRLLISDPLILCLPATVTLNPNYEGPINASGSGICYRDSDGQTFCEEFDNPTITVTYREVYLPIVIKDRPLPNVINGGFEKGWTGWTYGGELPQIITSTNPHSGNFSALLGEPSDDCEGASAGNAWTEQTVFVPPTASPKLSFWYRIFTYDRNRDLVDDFDSFDVKINNELKFRDANRTGPYGCNSDDPALEWRLGEIVLGDYSEKYITISFEISNTDKWFNTWAYVDDVQIDP